MRGRFTTLLFIALIAGSPLSAQQRDTLAITIAEIEAHLRFLSDDLLEGRYPGTRGERLTTAYLVSQLMGVGLLPAASNGWLQPVAVTVHDPIPGVIPEARITGRVTRALVHGRDIRLSNHSARPDAAAIGELVFVGYGIHAPVYGWDDFAGVDLAGKVAVALLGEPVIPGDSVRFNGVRASRFSSFADKIAELQRRGAVAVLWVRGAGTLSGAPAGGARRLADDAARATLVLTGSITDSALAGLLPPGAPPLARLLSAAAVPGFRPLPLGVRLDARLRTAPREVIAHNVTGVIRGTDSSLSHEHVVLTAHWDAYGVGAPVNGDSIYNGAMDDASGMAALLALARVFARHPQPRSLTFLFTFEEWGLLGAEAYVRSGLLPVDRIVANLNLDDGVELFGIKRDVAPLGVELSTLGQTVASVAQRMGLRVTQDPFPQEGFFLRADNFPFAKAGIPALYMALGTDGEGRPAGWVDARTEEYMQQHYHRPSDDYDHVVVDLRGAVQFAEFVRNVTIEVARARGRPQWLRGAEFQRP